MPRPQNSLFYRFDAHCLRQRCSECQPLPPMRPTPKGITTAAETLLPAGTLYQSKRAGRSRCFATVLLILWQAQLLKHPTSHLQSPACCSAPTA